MTIVSVRPELMPNRRAEKKFWGLHREQWVGSCMFSSRMPISISD